MSNAPAQPRQDLPLLDAAPATPAANAANAPVADAANPPAGARRRRSPVRAVFGRLPAAAWVCAAVALLNACAWSLITPPFQGKDEVDHYAYVAQLAQNGALPTGAAESYSAKQTLVMEGLHYFEVRFTPQVPSLQTRAQQRTLIEDLDGRLPAKASEEAGTAASQPPLYYALQTIPYLAAGPNILLQLQAMRLLSALLGAITVLLTFLFLREILPRPPWAATVGAVCVALQPLFGFMSGSVNPDTLLYTLTAGIFLCLARAYHRGLTRRGAVVLGLLIAAGFATKLNFLGVALGVFPGLLVLAVHAARGARRTRPTDPLRGVWYPYLLAAGIGALPIAIYAAHELATTHKAFELVLSQVEAVFRNPLNEGSYVWQLYLPRLPGMPQYFAGIATYRDIWFDRLVGMYGWMDTLFPEWVDNIALVPAAAVALLCGRELFVHRGALRARRVELAVYAAIVGGILLMLGTISYRGDAVAHELAFGEPRYLLPLLPLLGAVVALAARGAGRRWAPVAAAALVMLFLGHDLFSQLQVIGRYYG